MDLETYIDTHMAYIYDNKFVAHQGSPFENKMG